MENIMVAGVLESSMTDWEGRFCSTVFLGGCNLSCFFCHNNQLASFSSNITSWDETLELFLQRRNWIDSITISGGEPTVHPQILDILKDLKREGFEVNIHTNGALPEVLKTIIENELVRRISMDVKTNPSRYPEEEIRMKVPVSNILSSISLIKDFSGEKEFRTTLIKGLTEERDIKQIAELVAGKDIHYYLQRAAFDFIDNKKLKEEMKTLIVNPTKAEELRMIASQFVTSELRSY